MIPGTDNNVIPVGQTNPIVQHNTRPSNAAVLLAISVMAALAVAACSGSTAADTQKPIQVVTTTSLLADLTRNVAGSSAVVSAVIPPGADVHSFQTTPKDSIDISKAGLIVSNGGGLDNFLNPLIESALDDEAIHIVVSQGLTSEPDPHFWQNPLNAIHYVRRIQDGLSTADPSNADAYRERADAYAQQLTDLDREISQILEEIPPSRRHLVTYHDAFGHFGTRYGWRTSALVTNDAGGVTPSSISLLQERVRQEGITAMFTEPQFRSEVVRLAAQDIGVEVGTIYSDVSVGSAATYVGMMRLNAQNLAELLR